VALRIQLSLTSEQLDQPDQRAMFEQLGTERRRHPRDLRNVAQGVYPQLLEQHGIAAALRSASRSAALPVAVHDKGLTRHAPALELTIYYCCSEALQNAAKYAGAGASATIRLSEGPPMRPLHHRGRTERVSTRAADSKRGVGSDPNLSRPRGRPRQAPSRSQSWRRRGTRITGSRPG
jgi:signal transduction histidine kinase